jgi:Uncharacterized protein conserved in bacteria (DUF2334)
MKVPLDQDALRTARLFFSDEFRDGAITDRDLAAHGDQLAVFGSGPVPTLGVRTAQRLALKAKLLDFEKPFLSRVRTARRALLGPGADGPPKFLVRVDEFPDSRALDDGPERWRRATRAFHETLSAGGVPYLMAVVPQYTHRPLDPAGIGGGPLDDDDRTVIEQMARENVTFAQHGLTHRTRYHSPRRRSELCGLQERDTEALIVGGRERLADVGVSPRVFIPPFNRFDPRQLPQLARHFDVIGGGPETVALMGYLGGPVWRGDAVFLPCYAPLYAGAGELEPVAERMVELAVGTWVPLVIHISWEIGDGFRSLSALARTVAPYAISWDEFLQAVDRSRAESAVPPTARPL